MILVQVIANTLNEFCFFAVRNIFFLRKSSVAGSLQYCYGSVASVLHCDIIVVLNAKVRFDVSFIYKS